MEKRKKIGIIGAVADTPAQQVARAIGAMGELKLEGKDPSKAIAVQTREELKGVDPKLQEAYAKLSDGEKIQLQRGYKTWKTNGKSEYVLVDNIPIPRGPRGPKFTPKKKKRKK